MDMLLTGRTALVTGSSAGIGAVIASQLAAEGCRVLVHGRDEDRVTRRVEQIRRDGGQADGVTGDLGNAAETESDIAAAAVFLASPRADHINGTTLRVDGAITATVNP